MSFTAECCANPACAKPLDPDTRFCPFCATQQPLPDTALPPKSGRLSPEETFETPSVDAETAKPQAEEPLGQPANNGAQASVRNGRGSDAGSSVPRPDPALVLRAGEKVWHFEEDEGTPTPGQKRPLLVLDEQTTHLAHTDRQLTPEELLERVQALLVRDQVPIDVALKPTRWLRDTTETRPRLIASLRGHRYSDIKMLLGVDYLGRWASIHLALATEPEPTAAPPKFDDQPFEPSAPFALGPIILIVLGVLGIFMASSSGTNMGVLGVLAIIGGIFWLITQRAAHAQTQRQQKASWEEQQRQRRQAWEQEQQRSAQAKTAERLSRTFKVDDMRLFSTAMRQVFQSVVDDIVEQGGEVARIEGGQGGFFQNQGVTQAVPPPRQSDAAHAGV